MTCCQQCTGWAYEHLTSDQRILYCGNCGWEYREARARQAPAAPRRNPVGKSAAVQHRAQHR